MYHSVESRVPFLSKEILEFTRGQMKSSFSDVIKPNTKEFVYGGPSGIDKKWFEKNKDLFYENN